MSTSPVTTLPAPPSTAPCSGEHVIPRSSRPWVQDCPACDGQGKTRDVDYFDDGTTQLVWCKCEACDGSGQLANCISCDEILPAPEADKRGYVCECCTEALTVDDLDMRGVA